MSPEQSDRLIGTVLDGRYRIESRIARGGMAKVYLAEDVRLERHVAVLHSVQQTHRHVDRDRLADGITVGSLADGEQLVKDLYLRSSICNSDTSPCTR